MKGKKKFPLNNWWKAKKERNNALEYIQVFISGSKDCFVNRFGEDIYQNFINDGLIKEYEEHGRKFWDITAVGYNADSSTSGWVLMWYAALGIGLFAAVCFFASFVAILCGAVAISYWFLLAFVDIGALALLMLVLYAIPHVVLFIVNKCKLLSNKKR